MKGNGTGICVRKSSCARGGRSALPRARRFGFTLIEVLVSVAILVILVAIVVSYGSSSRARYALSVESVKVAQAIARARTLAVTTFGQSSAPCGYGVDIDYTAHRFRIFRYRKTVDLSGNETCGSYAKLAEDRKEAVGGWHLLAAEVEFSPSAPQPLYSVLFVPPAPATHLYDELSEQFTPDKPEGQIIVTTRSGTLETTIRVNTFGRVFFSEAPPPPPPQTCADGTPAGQCVPGNPPQYCDANGNLVDDCTQCNCPSGYSCDTSTGTCTIQTCADGTQTGQCVPGNPPQYCDANGNLVDDCTQCKCPNPSDTCNPDGTCTPAPSCKKFAEDNPATTFVGALVYDAALEQNVNGDFWYVVGTHDNWRIEKWRVDGGRFALCDTATCGTEFGIGGIQEPPIPTGSIARGIALDPPSGYMYVVGQNFGMKRWRIEKRRLDTGALCDAATCGTGFGDGGSGALEFGNNWAAAEDIAIDVPHGYMYVVGYDNAVHSSGPGIWRIEKRRLDTGELCTATACGTAFGNNGVAVWQGGAPPGKAEGVAIDPARGHLYVVGYRKQSVASPGIWRIEKRTLDTGDLCTPSTCGGVNFGNGGIVEFSGTYDMEATKVAIDTSGGYMYVVGRNGSSWRIEKRRLDTGKLCTAAACGTGFGDGGSGVVEENLTQDPAHDGLWAKNIALDVGDGYMYVVGQGSPHTWLIEKRRLDTGKLCTAAACGTGFGDGGSGKVAEQMIGSPDGIVLDIASGVMYLAGEYADASRWRVERRQLSTGELFCAP